MVLNSWIFFFDGRHFVSTHIQPPLSHKNYYDGERLTIICIRSRRLFTSLYVLWYFSFNFSIQNILLVLREVRAQNVTCELTIKLLFMTYNGILFTTEMYSIRIICTKYPTTRLFFHSSLLGYTLTFRFNIARCSDISHGFS